MAMPSLSGRPALRAQGLRPPATIVLRLQLTLIPVTGRQLTATASPMSHPERELR